MLSPKAQHQTAEQFKQGSGLHARELHVAFFCFMQAVRELGFRVKKQARPDIHQSTDHITWAISGTCVISLFMPMTPLLLRSTWLWPPE